MVLTVFSLVAFFFFSFSFFFFIFVFFHLQVAEAEWRWDLTCMQVLRANQAQLIKQRQAGIVIVMIDMSVIATIIIIINNVIIITMFCLFRRIVCFLRLWRQIQRDVVDGKWKHR